MEPKPTLREVWAPKGVPEAAWRVFEEDYSRVVAAWEQDIGTVGRILRGHLFVEHFLTEHLAARNPHLGPINDARLSFAQKLALVGRGTEAISDLLPGLRRLNAIRNRLAHSLHAEVTAEDAAVFLSGGVFRAMRDARDAPGVPSTEPVDVLEDFAKHAGLRLHHSCSRSAALWTRARRRA